MPQMCAHRSSFTALIQKSVTQQKWRFGAAITFSRVYIKGAFNLAVTNMMDDLGESNSFTVGVGYHF